MGNNSTGLKDREGRPIKEGDTVIVDDWLTGTVVFVNGGWRYDCGKKLMKHDSSYLFGDGAMKDVRVVKRAVITHQKAYTERLS